MLISGDVKFLAFWKLRPRTWGTSLPRSLRLLRLWFHEKVLVDPMNSTALCCSVVVVVVVGLVVVVEGGGGGGGEK